MYLPDSVPSLWSMGIHHSGSMLRDWVTGTCGRGDDESDNT